MDGILGGGMLEPTRTYFEVGGRFAGMNRIGGIYRMNGILGGGMLERTRTYFEVVGDVLPG